MVACASTVSSVAPHFRFHWWLRFANWLRLVIRQWSARSNGRSGMDGRQEWLRLVILLNLEPWNFEPRFERWLRLVKSPLGFRPSDFFRISAGRISDFCSLFS